MREPVVEDPRKDRDLVPVSTHKKQKPAPGFCKNKTVGGYCDMLYTYCVYTPVGIQY